MASTRTITRVNPTVATICQMKGFLCIVSYVVDVFREVVQIRHTSSSERNMNEQTVVSALEVVSSNLSDDLRKRRRLVF
jgi:hypothetical protein